MPVLLVVADESLRATWAEKLADQGHRVTALGSVDEARRYLRSFTPSIVVHHAPDDDEDTRAFMYDLSTREGAEQLPVVVLSATAGTARLAEACGFTVLDAVAADARLVSEVRRLAPNSRRSRTT